MPQSNFEVANERVSFSPAHFIEFLCQRVAVEQVILARAQRHSLINQPAVKILIDAMCRQNGGNFLRFSHWVRVPKTVQRRFK